MTITENCPRFIPPIEVSEICGKVIAIATAAKIESTAKAISVNSTLWTVIFWAVLLGLLVWGVLVSKRFEEK